MGDRPTTPADERQFTESELQAIIADRVGREVASLNATLEEKDAAIADLTTRLGEQVQARETAEADAATARQEFADFKAEQERTAELAAKRTERVAAAKEAAPHLPTDYFEDDARIERLVAMSDEGFASYVTELGDHAKVAASAGSALPPRETAMTGSTPKVGTETAPAARAFFGPSIPKEG